MVLYQVRCSVIYLTMLSSFFPCSNILHVLCNNLLMASYNSISLWTLHMMFFILSKANISFVSHTILYKKLGVVEVGVIMALVTLVMLLTRQTNLFLIILWVIYPDVAYRSIVELIIFESELAYYFNLSSKIINLSICFQLSIFFPSPFLGHFW